MIYTIKKKLQLLFKRFTYGLFKLLYGEIKEYEQVGSNSNSEILIERIMEREFILELSEKLSLKDDHFFQTYNPNAVDPYWKAAIKKLIG